VYRNDGNDTFIDIQASLTGVAFGSTDWGDYDEDGDLDLVVTGRSVSGTTSIIYRNDGSGTFTDIQASLIGVEQGSSTWGDYDGDGDLDLILTGVGNTLLYRNEGSDSFLEVDANLPEFRGFSSSSWGDYDDDGDLDLLLAGADGLRTGNTETAIYVNGGNGSFANPRVPGLFDSSSDWGDYDNDGDLDVVVTGNRDSEFDPDDFITKIYRNDEAGLVDIGAELLDISGINTSGSSDWGDYDNDGDIDLLLTGFARTGPTTIGPVSVIYRNDGEDDFTEIEANLQGVQEGFGRWGDYDNDGDLDIVIGGVIGIGDEIFSIYRNDENDTFTEIQTDLIDGTFGPTGDWGDYDGDGDLDLILTGILTGGGVTKIYRNDGGAFVYIDAGLEDVVFGLGRWGDYDGDGDLDLLIAGDGSEGRSAWVYRNDGQDTFSIVSELMGVESGSADWGDYDGDGDLDLVLAGIGTTDNLPMTKVYQNTGADTFIDSGISLPGVANGTSIWADADEDGDLDLLLVGSGVGQLHENLRLTGSPIETNTATVSTNGRVSFGNTGISVVFQSVSGSGAVTVRRYDTPPTSMPGISETIVSSYRVVIEADAGLSFSSGTEARFDADAFGGIEDPSEIQVYSRPSSGGSTFAALPTRYDESNGEIVADITDFSEFVLASNTNPLPVELARFTAASSGEAVTLRWSTTSEENNAGFDVERSTDGETFTTIGFEPGVGTTEEAQSYRFVDREAPFATTLFYRLRQVDTDGTFEYSPVVEVEVTPSAVALLPVAPNPVSASARLRYELPEATAVRLQVFDLLGRRVATLVDGEKPAGRHEVSWRSAGLASGTYFVRLQAGSTAQTQMLRLVR
jgi:hypothetical protein